MILINCHWLNTMLQQKFLLSSLEYKYKSFIFVLVKIIKKISMLSKDSYSFILLIVLIYKSQCLKLKLKL